MPHHETSDAIVIDKVFKRYRKPGDFQFATTLKSYLLRDAWRKMPHLIDETSNKLNWALQDINLHIAKGSTIGMIGRNGSGKSTLLKLIGRILKPDMGTVSIHGKVAALIELGAGFHPELTGIENIMINGVILGLSKQDIKDRLADIIAFADIGDYIKYPVRTYSSGMYARLGFSVAMHVDPDILLIDEILSVGDAKFTIKCQTALDHFKQQNKSIIVVSHNLDTVRSWCDEVVWLDSGKIHMQGAPHQVVEAYNKLTIAA